MIKGLVVCIGNDLVADDGIGKAVFDELQSMLLPDGIRRVYLGLGGIDLLEEMDGEELLVVVDGVQLGGQAGTIHQLHWQQLPGIEARPVSGHGISIKEAVIVASRLYPERCPKDTYLVGIEGECFNRLGEGLSPAVRKAVPLAAKAIIDLFAERAHKGVSP